MYDSQKAMLLNRIAAIPAGRGAMAKKNQFLISNIEHRTANEEPRTTSNSQRSTLNSQLWKRSEA
jgi:hypothetical protein